ncbi:MAG TPA: carbohydrate ABC transporter permease [Candidatus Hydrogenedentes bacterium]|jgi:ABC-type glycerol-3-phosphate transport system permease component|nr:carbohydrate ABC transporter permease [Candidatus Hydrogenedentota bacterium]MDY0033433.1 carbohydrate ABC transporter permease [FCB group bacterium]HNZ16980.1 carbohydrate ABC transporter permease [Candidatus Hydrogenedentota bacterium]HOH32668.1 carbohydrate ABC transporter permease [Candidatus Hydrogenedentota bacterium]HPA03190.1 carbohydrate ABC transporter permease [Candidatus Hydrogenedentota bacterium]
MFWKALKQAVIYAAMLAVVALFVFPFYWLLISAFKTKAQIFVLPPQFVPDPVVVQNFADVFRTTPIARAFVNSCVIAGGHTLLALFLCSMGGYAFAKYSRAPGRDKLFAFVLGTMMIPAAVTLIPVFIVLTRLHLVNTYWAMILPGAANAFGIFWMRQYIAANVHDDLLAAARIDGCSEFGIYWRVALPIARPALAALGILVVISSWNNLMWAFIVLREKTMYTMPLLIYLLHGELRTPYGMVMAGGLLVTLPLIVAFLVFQRSFIQGITAGALKA